MAMSLSSLPQAAAECREWARFRYPNRPLLCSWTAATAGEPERLLAAGGFDLCGARRVDLGRALLLKLPGPEGGATRTLLARVAAVDLREDGSWLVRCRFAGAPRDETGQGRTVACTRQETFFGETFAFREAAG
jgi:hypothetical protein